MEVVDNGDGTQTVNYVPSREGPYNIAVMYNDEEVPRRSVSPFMFCYSLPIILV